MTICLFVGSSAISRAGMTCHWEDNDVVAQEIYCNVRMDYRLI